MKKFIVIIIIVIIYLGSFIVDVYDIYKNDDISDPRHCYIENRGIDGAAKCDIAYLLKFKDKINSFKVE